MNKISGKIDNKKPLTTKTGKTFYAFIVAGTDITTWEKEIYDKFNEGDFVEATYQLKGQYKNLTMMMEVDEPIEEGSTKPVTSDQAETVEDTPLTASTEAPLNMPRKVEDNFLKFKTITANNQDDLDEQVNKFNKENDVKYTQTNLAAVSGESSYTVVFSVHLFYK